MADDVHRAGGSDVFSSRRYSFAVIWAIVLFSAAALAQSDRLEVGVARAKEIRPDQKHLYQFKARPGRVYRIMIRHGPSMDLLLTVRNAGRRKLGTVGGHTDSPNVEAGLSIPTLLERVALSFTAYPGADYLIEVDAGPSYISGRYEINIEEQGPANAESANHISADRLFEKADRIRHFSQNTNELRTALSHFENALAIYRQISDRRAEAFALDAAGLVSSQLGLHDKAIERLSGSVELLRSMGDNAELSIAMWHLAGVREAAKQMDASIADREEALRIARSAGDRIREARLLIQYAHALGKRASSDSEHQRVLELLRQSAQLFHELESPIDEAYSWFGLGAYYSRLANGREAIRAYKQGLGIVEPIGQRRMTAYALLRIGEFYYDLGDLQKATEYFGEALDRSSNPSNQYHAHALYNISNTTLTFDKKKVLENLTAALPLWEGNRNGEAYTLLSIGRWYYTEDQKDKALDYYSRALELMRFSGDPFGEGIILSHFGETYASMNDKAKAVGFYDEALKLHRATSDRRDEARTLLRLGWLRLDSGDQAAAFSEFAQALTIFREIGNRTGEANALYVTASAESRLGNIPAALTHMEAAIAIVESLRAGISARELRTAYSASIQQYYELYVSLLMTLHEKDATKGFDRRALEAAESGKARSLIELLATSQVDLRDGVDRELIDRENELLKQLDEKAAEQVRLMAGPHTTAQAVSMERSIEELTTRLELLRGRIFAASPRSASLATTFTDIASIQKQLDGETLLLEYRLGTERSFLWVVSEGDVRSFVLPSRETIEKLARRSYERLASWKTHARRPVDRRDDASRQDARELSDVLLRPAAKLLGEKRLVIVSDGALQYLPFGALPRPSAGEKATADGEPLIAGNEIVYLPSAATIGALRREAASRGPAAKAVAIFADPVFSPADSRVRSESGSRRRSAALTTASASRPAFGYSTQRALDDLGLDTMTGIPRLPFSRLEAEAIGSLAPAASLKLLDFAANRNAAESPDLAKYRIVHFATHGLLNSAHPDLSGLLFSMVDESGKPQNGLLSLQEIYRLRLNADMVVLSACQTGLGKEISGEGLVGLTRGFMYAGTPRVIASLWKVDDAATADLMRHFYKAVLQDGKRPAAALRAAQIEMRKNERWKAPYFWAAFTLQGEWK